MTRTYCDICGRECEKPHVMQLRLSTRNAETEPIETKPTDVCYRCRAGVVGRYNDVLARQPQPAQPMTPAEEAEEVARRR
jgi:hypothetical protein